MTARALVSEPGGHVLLIRVHDEVALDAADPVRDYWITVGGGVEAGESFEQAIVREVFEETGHRIPEAGPCVWRRRAILIDEAGVRRESDERYFWCRLPSTDLSAVNLTPIEREVIREFRWWDLRDPELSKVRIFPTHFADAARNVLLNGPPAVPLDLT